MFWLLEGTSPSQTRVSHPHLFVFGKLHQFPSCKFWLLLLFLRDFCHPGPWCQAIVLSLRGAAAWTLSNTNYSSNRNFSRNPQCRVRVAWWGLEEVGSKSLLSQILPYPLYFWLFLFPQVLFLFAFPPITGYNCPPMRSVEILVSLRQAITMHEANRHPQPQDGSGWWKAATSGGVENGHQKPQTPYWPQSHSSEADISFIAGPGPGEQVAHFCCITV